MSQSSFTVWLLDGFSQWEAAAEGKKQEKDMAVFIPPLAWNQGLAVAAFLSPRPTALVLSSYSTTQLGHAPSGTQPLPCCQLQEISPFLVNSPYLDYNVCNCPGSAHSLPGRGQMQASATWWQLYSLLVGGRGIAGNKTNKKSAVVELAWRKAASGQTEQTQCQKVVSAVNGRAHG